MTSSVLSGTKNASKVQQSIASHTKCLNNNDQNIAPITKEYEEMPIEADIASDHGKELAQQKWAKLMQTAPTRLTF